MTGIITVYIGFFADNISAYIEKSKNDLIQRELFNTCLLLILDSTSQHMKDRQFNSLSNEVLFTSIAHDLIKLDNISSSQH